MYIQSAEIGQKNESLSKNKSLKINEDLFANVKLSFKLFSVIQTIESNQSNKRARVIFII